MSLVTKWNEVRFEKDNLRSTKFKNFEQKVDVQEKDPEKSQEKRWTLVIS